HCTDGVRDCMTGVCVGNVCVDATCIDGVKNGNETDLNCGGGTCPRCTPGMSCADGPRDCDSFVCTATVCQAPACPDGVKNGNERDDACGGGGVCAGCAAGKHCTDGPRDCTSKVCVGTVCQIPACNDGQQNGNETDQDCGGGAPCTKCIDGKHCTDGPRDC